jgi:hypothetical protein
MGLYREKIKHVIGARRLSNDMSVLVTRRASVICPLTITEAIREKRNHSNQPIYP